jgi:hypothetical protein
MPCNKLGVLSLAFAAIVDSNLLLHLVFVRRDINEI